MANIVSQKKKKTRVSTALLLAAGTGSRLLPLTDSMPKCLTEIRGIPILQRLLDSLRQHRFNRLVVVVGHLEQEIRRFLELHAQDFTVDYVVSPVYDTTNNIYSLWLAGETIREPFLLIESDLVFDPSLLGEMLDPDQIAVSEILPWMNGTTVKANAALDLTDFSIGTDDISNEIYYKTVNIYSLSSETWQSVRERLDLHIRAGRVNEYYEVVFKELVAEGNLTFQCVKFDSNSWYEVDTLEDLQAAQILFSKPSQGVYSSFLDQEASIPPLSRN